MQLYISIITAWPVNEDEHQVSAVMPAAAQSPDAAAVHRAGEADGSVLPTGESVSGALACSVLAVAGSRWLAVGLGIDTAYLAFVAVFATLLGAAGRQFQPSGALFAGDAGCALDRQLIDSSVPEAAPSSHLKHLFPLIRHVLRMMQTHCHQDP